MKRAAVFRFDRAAVGDARSEGFVERRESGRGTESEKVGRREAEAAAERRGEGKRRLNAEELEIRFFLCGLGGIGDLLRDHEEREMFGAEGLEAEITNDKRTFGRKEGLRDRGEAERTSGDLPGVEGSPEAEEEPGEEEEEDGAEDERSRDDPKELAFLDAIRKEELDLRKRSSVGLGRRDGEVERTFRGF